MSILSKAADDYLGFTHWRMREDANLLFKQKLPEVGAGEVLSQSASEGHLPKENVENAALNVCSLCVPTNAESSLLHLLGDIVRLLNKQDAKYSRFDMEVNDPLPAAPAICFIAGIDCISEDAEGRLLIPVNCFDLSALEWKPRLWAYLQSLLAT